MKIAVTGGSGRIGSATVRMLRERGHDVLSLDVRPPEDTSIKHQVIDLRAPSAVREVFDGQDVVLHLGEMPGVGRELSDAYTHNIDVGAHVMQIACQVGVKRIVYTSSCQVYGIWGIEMGPCADPLYLPLDEKHPMNPQNPYALSKASNERFAAMVSKHFHVPIAAFRLPAVWQGAVDDINNWMKRRKRNEPPRDGMGTYLHVSDAANAYVCAAERGWGDGFEAFHFVADDHVMPVSSREAMLQRHPNAPLPENWPADASPVVTTKAKTMLGWQPKVKFRERILEQYKLPMSAVA